MALKKLSSPILMAATDPVVDPAAQERTLSRSSACQPGQAHGHMQVRTDRNPIATFDIVSAMKQYILAYFLLFCFQLIALSHMGRAESSP